MAQSFDKLLTFLIDKIALQGEQGAQRHELSLWIDNFYSEEQEESTEADLNQLLTQPLRPTLDASFRDTVWNWLLTREDLNQGITPSRCDKGLSSKQQHFRDNCNASTDGQADGFQQQSHSSEDTVQNGLELTLFAPEEHMWHALTGHGIDYRKVPQLQFHLLSIIAAHGKRGVSQPDLTRISGQDKRSTPKRTDRLCENGYIDKKPVIVNNMHMLTSQCTLKRYSTQVSRTKTAWHDLAPQDLCQDAFHRNGHIDLSLILDVVTEMAKNREFVTTVELRERLGIVARRWERHTFLGILKRIALMKVIEIGHVLLKGSKKQLFTRSIKFVRDPTEEERIEFGRIRFQQRLDDLANEEDEGPLMEDDDEGAFEEGDQSFSTMPQEIHAGAGCWSADEPLQNQLYDLIAESGVSGISSSELHRKLGLGFYKKPMEVVAGRMTEHGTKSQPAHLRHLAIVRDVTVQGKNRLWFYRSLPNFELAVARGETSWQAIGEIAKPVDSELDEWGFPVLNGKDFLPIEHDGQMRHSGGQTPGIKTISSPNVSNKNKLSSLKRKNPDHDTSLNPKRRGRTRKRCKTNADISEVAPLLRTSDPDDQATCVPDPGTEDEAAEHPTLHNTRTLSNDLTAYQSPPSFHEEGQWRLRQFIHNDEEERTTTSATKGFKAVLGQGLHINPPGRRRRGRPRKDSTIAVFKLDRLRELSWFRVYENKSMSVAEEHLSYHHVMEKGSVSSEPNAVSVDTSLGDKPSQRSSDIGTHFQPQQTPAMHTVSRNPHTDLLPTSPDTNRETELSEADGVPETMAREPETDSRLEVSTVDRQAPRTASNDLKMSVGTPLTNPYIAESRAPRKRRKLNASTTERYHASAYRQNGYLSQERYDILEQILRQAGGVYPGGKELWWAFATKIRALKGPKATVLDPTTLQRSVATLVRDQQLRVVTFTFKSFSGTNMSSKILAWTSIEEGDERVEQLKRKIKEAYPQSYFPDTVSIDKKFIHKAGQKSSNSGPHAHSWNSLSSTWMNLLSAKDKGFDSSTDSLREPAWYRWYRENLLQQKLEAIDKEAEADMTPEESSMHGSFQLSLYADDPERIRRERISKHSGLMHFTPPPGPGEGSRTSAKALSETQNSSSAPKTIQSAYMTSEDIAAVSVAPRTPLSSLAVDPTISRRPPLSRIIGLKRFGRTPELLQKMRALCDPAQTFHTPSGTFSSVYKLQTRRRKSNVLFLDTAAPARFESQMPSSLSDMLDKRSQGRNSHLTQMQSSTRAADAFAQIDEVAQWEIENEELLTQGKELGQVRFINHYNRDVSSLKLPDILRQSEIEALEKDQAPRSTAQILVEIDQVADWERQHTQIFISSQPLRSTPFINHLVARNATEWQVSSVPANVIEEEVRAAARPAMSRSIIRAETIQSANDHHSASNTQALPRKYQRLRKVSNAPRTQRNEPLVVEAQNDDPQFEDTDMDEPPILGRNATRRPSVLMHSNGTLPAGTQNDVTSFGTAQNIGISSRSPQEEYQARPHKSYDPTFPFTGNEVDHFIVVVVVTRTLAGGIEKQTDWTLIESLLKLDLAGRAVVQAWVKIRQNRLNRVRVVEDAFPDAYLRAFEMGEVPSVNFSSIADTDWDGIFQWALESIPHWRDLGSTTGLSPEPVIVPSERAILPNTYEALNTSFEQQEQQQSNAAFDHLQMLNTRNTDLRLREIQISSPFEITHQPKQAPDGKRSQIEDAKTFVRAQLLTRSYRLNREKAEQELSKFPEKILTIALKSLESDKAIIAQGWDLTLTTGHKSRMSTGINKLVRHLPIASNMTLFRQAIVFKRQMDAAFSSAEKRMLLPDFVNDGTALALLNLTASNRVEVTLDIFEANGADGAKDNDNDNDTDIDGIRPIERRVSRWGAQMRNSRTAALDQTQLHFPLVVRPTCEYIPGLPPLESSWHPPPPADEDRLPMWWDMSGAVLKEQWCTIILSLVCYLAVRPQCTAGSITTVWGKESGLQTWEVEAALAWLEARGVVESVQGRWRTSEWWWCMLGEEQEGDVSRVGE